MNFYYLFYTLATTLRHDPSLYEQLKSLDDPQWQQRIVGLYYRVDPFIHLELDKKEDSQLFASHQN